MVNLAMPRANGRGTASRLRKVGLARNWSVRKVLCARHLRKCNNVSNDIRATQIAADRPRFSASSFLYLCKENGVLPTTPEAQTKNFNFGAL